ncbi:MAG TPA: CHAT domain-containing tetratricopeptide repeat protein [Pyrinomonadaceae bacterium]|jgi:CHAT domain-containing protein
MPPLSLAASSPSVLSAPSAYASASRGQASEPVKLTSGETIRQEIGGTDVHLYAVELAEKQYARILVKQQGSDVVVTVINRENKRTVIDRPNGAGGHESVSLMAQRGEQYRLEIRTLERAARRGQYEISISEQRPSVPRDESRMAAERVVTEAEILRARKTAVTLPQALEKFGQAIALWRALDESYETAVALYGRCLTYRLLGSNEQAIADCGESASLMRAQGDDYGEAVARTGRGWAYIYLGDADKASVDFVAALETRRRINEQLGQPLDLLGLGWVAALREDYAKALDYFQQSHNALGELGDPRGKAIRLAAIGEVYRRTKRPQQAISYLTQSLQLSRAAGTDRGGEAETLTSIGWCRYALGEMSQAQSAFAEALPLRRAAGDRTGEAITMLGQAHVERAQGNLYNARLQVESALAIIESLRAQMLSQPLRLSFFALALEYYEFHIDLLMEMQRLNPNQGYAAAALEASERARARSLLDLLNESGVDVRQGVPPALLEHEHAVRLKLNSAANYQRQLLSESYTTAQAAAAAKEVDDLSVALSEVETQIRQVSPRYASLTRPQPLTASSIQREVVDADTLLLEYALGKERSFLWVVSPTTLTSYELPARLEIEQAVLRVHESLTARGLFIPNETPARKRFRIAQADGLYEGAAARLSQMLLAPAAAQLGAKRLLVVAPGVMQLVAFSALPDPSAASNGESQPLVLGHEIVTMPSASTLALLRRETARRPSKLIAIFADPVFSLSDERLTETQVGATPAVVATASKGGAFNGADGTKGNNPAFPAGAEDNDYRALPRLFMTRWEAERIAELARPRGVVQALDFDANRETAVGAGVGESRIIHFATHAIVNNAHPELSGIALSMFDRDGRPQDGFLRAHDIFNLKISADLVVLSACRTALGKEFKGEGLVGLARGFMYAGAQRVVGSLWATDDRATAELMVRFYRKLLRDGSPPGAALRAAQSQMWKEKRWREPYYWAGFVLQGEWH